MHKISQGDLFLESFLFRSFVIRNLSMYEIVGAREGLNFLDLGSGSGIVSLAAKRLGAKVHSIDYDAPEGTLVVAALDSVVISIKNDSQFGGDDPTFEKEGNFIEILHANDEVSELEF